MVNRKSAVDGLFAWLSTVSQNCHLNIVHAKGIWTSRKSDIVVLTDPTVVFVVYCFIASPAMHLTSPSKDSDLDPDFVTPFLDPWDTENSFVTILQVLNDPVCDIAMRLNKTGL